MPARKNKKNNNSNGQGQPAAKPEGQEPNPAEEKITTEIMEWALEMRNMLMREAKADPNTDATKIIQVLLLNAIVNDRAQVSELTFTKLLEEQRRYRELEGKTAKWKTDLEQGAQRIKLAKLKLKEARRKIQAAQKNHQTAKLADFEGILSTISAAIGVGEPLVPRVESGA